MPFRVIEVVPRLVDLLPQFLAFLGAQLRWLARAVLLLRGPSLIVARPGLLRRRRAGVRLPAPALLRFGSGRTERENECAQAETAIQ